MKKVRLLGLVLALVLAVAAFAGCANDTVLENAEKDYYVTGQFAGWGDAVGNDAFKMEAVALSDSRIASLKSALKDAKYVYVIDVTITDEGAGWEAEYVENGEVKTADGNQTMKWLQVTKGDVAPDWWAQSPESGEVKNLTPDLLFIPGFTETPEVGPDWNGNPVVLKAGDYTVVFAVFADYKAAGVIAK
ncbi:MAG: hypothetical protein ACOX17_02890 [Christensenellales bacterium]|jgi:hypothetical protein